MPTKRQIEAYRLVHIHKSTQRQAAAIMGVSQPFIAKLLLLLKESRPELFEDKRRHIRRKKPFSFNEERDSQPYRKF
jgi:hypothetical protein